MTEASEIAIPQTLWSLREEVDKGVQSRIIPAVLERLGKSHKKKWRTCPCRFCSTKRAATHAIGVAYVGAVRESGYIPSGWLHSRSEKEIIREGLRSRYRGQLKEEMER